MNLLQVAFPTFIDENNRGKNHQRRTFLATTEDNLKINK